MSVTSGEHVALLAADLRQPVSSVGQFFDALDRGADIVIGRRSFGARRSLAVAHRLGGVLEPLPPLRAARRPGWQGGCLRVHQDSSATCSFRCTRPTGPLIGLLLSVRAFGVESVAYPRLARTAPRRSGWTLARKLRYAFDSVRIFGSSLTLIVVVGAAGIVAALASRDSRPDCLVVGIRRPARVHAADARRAPVVPLHDHAGHRGCRGYVWRIFENTRGAAKSHIVRSVERIEPGSAAAGGTGA